MSYSLVFINNAFTEIRQQPIRPVSLEYIGKLKSRAQTKLLVSLS